MDADYLVQALDFLSRARKAAKKTGMKSLQTGRNFDRFREIVFETGQPLSEHFDDKYIDRIYQNGTWIVGRCGAGQAIATAAMRRDDLGETSLADSVRTQLRRLNGGLPERTSPGPDHISGETVYCGQYWVHEKFRRRKLAPIFASIVQAVALVQYSPDACYALTKKKLVEDGFGVRSGFVHGEPHAHRWLEQPSYMPTYHFLWNELKDLHWMVEAGHESCVQDEQTRKTSALHSRTE